MDTITRLKDILLTTPDTHSVHIAGSRTLKQACVYCVLHNVSPQQYGPLLEKYIINEHGYTKSDSKDGSGDCTDSKEGRNIEIKVSMGGSKRTKFNYVQLRPAHSCEMYILVAYYLCIDNVENEGDLYIFSVPKDSIETLICKYGSYAHGTVKSNGPITRESLACTKLEYALRPSFGDSCWKELEQFATTTATTTDTLVFDDHEVTRHQPVNSDQ
jgi:hypothetical protein